MCLQVKKLKDCRQHQELGERHGAHFLSELPERTNLADAWILDFKPELQENKFLLFLRYPVCGTFLQQPWETNTAAKRSSNEFLLTLMTLRVKPSQT